MPIYEYRCGACGHSLEALQKVSEPPLTECPDCHQGTLAKLVSPTSFQLKGTGWYATDFKTKPEKKTEGNTDNKPTETKAEKTETKTDTSTSTKTTDN